MIEGVPEATELLCDPVLTSVRVAHGFGLRGSQPPESTVFSRQVHGLDILEALAASGQSETSADIVLTSKPGVSVGIVTADCVPILVAAPGAGVVAAIHAGWRGLAGGVIERGIEAVRTASDGAELVAAVGPGARGCCYEVDGPVRDGLAQRYERHLDAVLVPTSEAHFQLDLPDLAARVLGELGLASDRIGLAQRQCTICDPVRFESYRRDGAQAGRLRHFISNSGTIPGQG